MSTNFSKMSKHVKEQFFPNIISCTQIKQQQKTSDTKIKVPYPVESIKNDVHYTYLDTVGRPVIVIHKKNAVESHIQDFQVGYFLTYGNYVFYNKI